MYRSELAFLPLGLALALPLVGCGGKTTSADLEPARDSGESPILFSAERDGALYVVAARPDTRQVRAFGPALPLRSDAYRVETLHVAADGLRVAVVLAPKVGTPDWTARESQLLLGDGASWQTLDHGTDLVVQSVAPDLSLLVTGHSCPASSGSADFKVAVIRRDGTHAYDDGTCTLGHPAAFVESIAPDGSYFVVQSKDGALTLHLTSGGEVALTPSGSIGIVGQCFTTSLLLADGPRARWIDTAGRPIEVPGWPSAISTPSGLQVLDGALYALEDRAMRKVSAIPAGVDPSTVVGLRDGLVLTRLDYALRTDLVDAKGSVVASYGPAPAHSSPRDPSGTPGTVVSFVTASTTSVDAWTVFADDYQTTRPTVDGSDVYERAEDLWLFVDRAGKVTSKTVELRRAVAVRGDATTWASREYVSSSSGAYVLFTDSGALHAFDVDSSVDRVLTTDFIVGNGGPTVRAGAH